MQTADQAPGYAISRRDKDLTPIDRMLERLDCNSQTAHFVDALYVFSEAGQPIAAPHFYRRKVSA
jgi:hypothetical protein